MPSFSASGGTSLGNSAGYSIILPYSASGGLRFSGSSPAISSYYSYVASGGLNLGNTVNPVTSSQWRTTAGGTASLGSSAGVTIYVNATTSGNVNLGGAAPSTIILYYTASGSLSAGGTSPAIIDLNFSTTFTWDISQGVLRSWRIEGKCQTKNSVYTTTLNQDMGCPASSSMQYFTNVQAHSITELCKKLKEREMLGPIKKIQMWSLPVNKSDWISTDNPNYNKLTSIDFSKIPDCIDFTVDFDLSVSAKVGSNAFSITDYSYAASGGLGISGQVVPPVASYYAYVASGGLNFGNGSTVSSPQYYAYTASGGLRTFGSTNAYGSDYGVLSVSGKMSMTTMDVGIVFGIVAAPTLTASTTQISATCCTSLNLPQILLTRHELNRSSQLSNFLKVNGFVLPQVISLMYSQSRNSWYYNKQFRGNAVDQGFRENWNIVFEFGCLTENPTLGVPSDVWGFSVLVRRENLTNSRIDVTRLVLEFDPVIVCNVSGSLKFDFAFNKLLLTTSPSVVRTVVFVDEVGAFNGTSYLLNPVTLFEVGVANPNLGVGLFDQSTPFKNMLLSTL